METYSSYQFPEQLLTKSTPCNYDNTHKDHFQMHHQIATTGNLYNFQHIRGLSRHEPKLRPVLWFPKQLSFENDVKLVLTLTILALLVHSVSCAAFPTETVTVSDARSQQLVTPCHRHFGHRIEACVRPFLSRLDVTKMRDDPFKDSTVSVSSHICLEYQLVLLCLHSALADCPNLSSLKRVQFALGSHWVAKINQFCAIPVQNPPPSSQTNTEDLTDSASQQTLIPSHNLLSKGMIQNLLQSPTEDTENVAPSSKQNDHIAGLDNTRTRLSPDLREKSGIEQSKDGGSHDVNVNIYNFVNNYQYDRPRVQHETDRSRPSLVNIRWEKSSCGVCSASLCLIAVLCFTAVLIKSGI